MSHEASGDATAHASAARPAAICARAGSARQPQPGSTRTSYGSPTNSAPLPSTSEKLPSLAYWSLTNCQTLPSP